MFVSGVVVLSFPLKNVTRIASHLQRASRLVERVLYVKFERSSAIATNLKPSVENNCSSSSVENVSKQDLLRLVPDVYRIASTEVPSIDVRVLINPRLQLAFKPEVLFTDFDKIEQEFWLKYATSRFSVNLNKVEFFDCADENNKHNETASLPPSDTQIFNNVCLGGTFDDLHNGHKVLLNEALLRCNNSFTVGVTDESMIKKKSLWELIAPVEQRINDLRDYLQDIDCSLKLTIVPISDPFGPAIEDENLDCLIVSEETVPGGKKINEIRQNKNMSSVHLFIVNLVKDKHHQSSLEEDKISSSSLRLRKLGTLLRKPEIRPNLPNRPYLIGITGGIASGKTHLCEKMKSLGAGIINCDLLAHKTYSNVDAPAYKQIVDTFGKSILNNESVIDRRKLGEIVFSDPAKLNLLNSIVWPATAALVEEEISRLKKECDIIVLEAAVLLEAHWEYKVHEVWVSIIPEEEAVTRLKSRNLLTDAEARKRISSQLSNIERVKRAHVVFCSLWDYNFTESQVDKAWNLLRSRLPKTN
ncbi:bifunctional coenzyme A synthase-like protein [Leptotrombidium deliense]|uniref:Bifunctional coenzyme A synthase n=1 Tax=Leptotrombidium deliense TaxID=299467 RepID=A0A443SP02_9ACAR|nr:bifunctional coenzyme A synthase-like protein [Leptotrombidium deliense]